MKFKKIIFCLLVACLLLPVIGVAAEEVQEEKKVAEVYFDGKSQDKNIQEIFFSGVPTYQSFDGVKVLNLGQGDQGYYAYINVNNKLFSRELPTPVAVTVRYRDVGKGYFTLRYTTTTATYVEPNEKVEMKNTGEWKEYTFRLDDCCFRDASGGCDLMLAAWSNNWGASAEPIFIQWAKIEKCFPKEPMTFSLKSEKIGNIFDDNDAKVVTPTYLNISEVPLRVKSVYEVKDYNNTVLKSGETESVEVLPGETVSGKAIDMGDVAKKFGCYHISLKNVSEGMIDGKLQTIESQVVDYNFSIANLLDKDEPSNHLIKMNTHWSYFDPYYIPEYDMPLMVQAGISGVRDAIQWQAIERQAGEFNSDRFDRFLDLAKEYDLDIQVQFCFSNTLYFDGTAHQIPDPNNKIQMDAFKRYVDFLTKKYKDQIYYWEFWNEPNLTLFNDHGRSGAEYAAVAKEIYPIVKKNDPDSSFGVFSTAQIPMDFIGDAVDAGILEYTDCVTLHPYDWEARGKGADYHFRNEFYRQRMTEFKEYMTEHDADDMEILVDEIGVSTTLSNRWGSRINQAAIIAQEALLTLGDNLADALYFYEWASDSLNQDDQEANWGFVECSLAPVPFAAKPNYLMLTNFNKYLTNAETIDKIVKDDASIYRFRRANGEQIIAFWDEKDAETFAVDLGVNKIKTMDLYGNITGELQSENGVYDLHATFEPMYLLGSFTKLEEAEPTVTITDGRQYAANDDYVTFTLMDEKKRDNLVVTAESTEKLEVVETSYRGDGVWDVKVHTSTDAVKDNEIILIAQDGDKCVLYTKCHVIIQEPFAVNAQVVKQSEQSPTRYQAQVNITNTTNSSNITGEVTADFTEFGGTLEQRQFKNVKPGQTVSVYLNLPEQIVKRTLNATGEVKLSYGYTTPVNFNLSVTNVGYAKGAANLTGPIDYTWWNGGDWFAADDNYAAKYFKDWGGKADSSFLATCKWDEENFYMLMIAQDDVFFQERSGQYMWQGDGLQFDLSTTTEDGKITAEYTEFGVAKTPEGMQVYRYNSQDMYNSGTAGLPTSIVVENAESTMEQINGEYVYRIRIPWTEIFGAEAAVYENDIYGFSVILNDNDGDGRYWMEYTSGVGKTKDTQLFGKITLIK